MFFRKASPCVLENLGITMFPFYQFLTETFSKTFWIIQKFPDPIIKCLKQIREIHSIMAIVMVNTKKVGLEFDVEQIQLSKLIESVSGLWVLSSLRTNVESSRYPCQTSMIRFFIAQKMELFRANLALSAQFLSWQVNCVENSARLQTRSSRFEFWGRRINWVRRKFSYL